jgi:hypothetical protein
LRKQFQRRRFWLFDLEVSENFFLEINQSETRMACLYKDCSFCPDPLTNMATTGNSCFWLADFFKSSPLKQGELKKRGPA